MASSEDYLLLARFDHPEDYPPFLRAGSLRALQMIGQEWRQEARRLGVAETVWLPITSFVRSEAYQAQLSAIPGKLALPAEDSTHPTGWPFDIDSSSHYVLEDGEVRSASRRDPAAIKTINLALEAKYGRDSRHTKLASAHLYNPSVFRALHSVTDRLHAEGAINKVVEFPGTRDECLHIGVNPEAFSDS